MCGEVWGCVRVMCGRCVGDVCGCVVMCRNTFDSGAPLNHIIFTVSGSDKRETTAAAVKKNTHSYEIKMNLPQVNLLKVPVWI